jgi:predicted protein tyrosine phosphatase
LNDDVDLHPSDLRQAHELARAWGISPLLAEVGPVKPADGVAYLLALYGTYCRGSRFWAVPRDAGLLCRRPDWDLIVTDRDGITHGEVMRVSVPHVVISIRDPRSRPVKARTNALCLGVHALAFHDAEPDDRIVGDLDVPLMTDRQANGIWRFLHEHADRIKAVVAHCEAGASRSPATLIAIGQAVGANTKTLTENFNPNRHVINVLGETFRQRRWLVRRETA